VWKFEFRKKKRKRGIGEGLDFCFFFSFLSLLVFFSLLFSTLTTIGSMWMGVGRFFLSVFTFIVGGLLSIS
jgi:hypothetical protein